MLDVSHRKCVRILKKEYVVHRCSGSQWASRGKRGQLCPRYAGRDRGNEDSSGHDQGHEIVQGGSLNDAQEAADQNRHQHWVREDLICNIPGSHWGTIQNQLLYWRKQGRIHGSISHERWAGALMEVRSLFGFNSAVWKKTRDGTTDGRTDPNIESLVRD